MKLQSFGIEYIYLFFMEYILLTSSTHQFIKPVFKHWHGKILKYPGYLIFADILRALFYCALKNHSQQRMYRHSSRTLLPARHFFYTAHGRWSEINTQDRN